MREQPKLSMPPKVVSDTKSQGNKVITQVREYKLITPLFGGGVSAGEIDPVTPIRGTEIRGQLRFWWRACRGGQFAGNLQKMKEAEDALWGKAYLKGEKPVSQEQLVQISVEISQVGRPKRYSDRDIPAYAAFPMQDKQKDLREGITFILTISFPQEKQIDIDAALWAWETFGGIGARTRRGFGALQCTTIKQDKKPIPVNLPQANPKDAQQWLQQQLDIYVIGNIWPSNVPHLAKRLHNGQNIKFMIQANTSSSNDCWYTLIQRLKNFRQMRRSSNRQGMGRSLWPEPSTIRNLTRQSDPKFKTPIPDPLIEKFPRAVFGLPIIFQFKDSDKRYPDNPYRDPRKTSLELKEHERFASPLILKPLACSGERYIGLATILEGTLLDTKQLVLKTQEVPKQDLNVSASLDDTQTLTLQDNVQISKQTNALQAFMKYL